MPATGKPARATGGEGMRAVLVANPKGGAGKTTLATNLAGGLAARDAKVFLWDLDRQQSSANWLSMRPEDRPAIHAMGPGKADKPRNSGANTWLVLDSAAGLQGKTLSHALRLAHKILVPVQPSLFDMAATGAFLEALVEEKAVRKQKTLVGIVGMRVDPRTRAAATLEAFLAQFDLPILTCLRDTQTYANAAFNGLSIFDLPQYLSARDVEQWQPVLDWVEDGG